MKKQLLSFIVVILSFISSHANHISGGEMYYTYLGIDAFTGFPNYSVTLKLFRDPAGGGPNLETSQNIAIYEKGTNILRWSGNVTESQSYTTTLTYPNPCIISPPVVSFDIKLYTFTVPLAPSQNGYIIVFQRCCRLSGITNVASPSSNFGSTYTAEIPGFEPSS